MERGWENSGYRADAYQSSNCTACSYRRDRSRAGVAGYPATGCEEGEDEGGILRGLAVVSRSGKFAGGLWRNTIVFAMRRSRERAGQNGLEIWALKLYLVAECR